MGRRWLCKTKAWLKICPATLHFVTSQRIELDTIQCVASASNTLHPHALTPGDSTSVKACIKISNQAQLSKLTNFYVQPPHWREEEHAALLLQRNKLKKTAGQQATYAAKSEQLRQWKPVLSTSFSKSCLFKLMNVRSIEYIQTTFSTHLHNFTNLCRILWFQWYTTVYSANCYSCLRNSFVGPDTTSMIIFSPIPFLDRAMQAVLLEDSMSNHTDLSVTSWLDLCLKSPIVAWHMRLLN